MKTRTWIALLGGLFLLSLALCLWPREPKNQAEIYCDGVLLRTVSLEEDTVFTLETAYGTNEITVSHGRLGVTAADCPGGDCVHQGFRNEGAPIVCLPHRLVIRFTGGPALDGVSG